MKGNALGYLLHRKIHNQIVNFFKKPVRLIYVVILLAMLIVTLIGGNSDDGSSDRVLRDFSELTAGLNALLLLIFCTTFNSGLSNGGTFFRMADVNYLFPSPLNRMNILFYALIQQIGTSMLIGFFILFQYTMLHVKYGLSFGGLFLIFIVYSVNVFLSQTLAMFVYTFVSDSDKKKRTAKAIFYMLILALVAYVGFSVLQGKDDILKAAVQAANSLPVCLFPFAGWQGAFAASILIENYLSALLWLSLSIAVFLLMLVAMSRSKRDYYEDVLASAEAVQTTVDAAKGGVVPEATPRNIKVGKTGIGRGQGASVFFYKHLLENRRASKIVIKPMSLIFIICTILFAVFAKGAGLMAIFAFSAYILIFSIALGRFNRELTKPYIYLVPEPPFSKMVFALAETLPSELLESVLIFLPVSIIMEAPAELCILCIFARLSFSILFLASSILIDRIWGASLSKVAGIFIYLFADLILILPGVGLAVLFNVLGINLISSSFTIIFSLMLSNIPIAALVIYLCRNMLQYAET